MRIAIALMLAAVVVGCATTPSDESSVQPPDQTGLAHVHKVTADTAPATAATDDTVAAIAAVKTYKFGGSREPLAAVERMVKESMKSSETSRAVAAELAAILGSDATLDAKQFACRQLVLVGSAENVPAIAPLLLDPQTADMARYALEPIQTPEVDGALIAALEQAPDTAKIGIINSLGARRSIAAADKIRPLTQSSDPAIADAAKAALARIGG